MKRNEVLMHRTTWVNFKIMFQSERSQEKGYVLSISIYVKI